jgi:hypothetical protein
MGIILVKADGNDGGLRSEGTWLDTGATPYQQKIRQGHTIRLEDDPQLGKHLITGGFGYGPHPPGANGSGGMRAQAFVEFKTEAGLVLPPNTDLITASVRTTRFGYEASDPNNWGGDDSLQFWNREWTAPLSTQAWVDLNALGGVFDPDFEYFRLFQMRKGEVYHYPSTPEPELLEAGGEKFLEIIKDKLEAGEPYKALLTNYTSLYDYPGSYSWVMWLTSSSGDVLTKQKPHIILRTQKRHDLDKVGGASIQMTDGTAVFLRYDRVAGAINLFYQRINSSTPVLIKKLPTTSAEHANFYSLNNGFQTFGLTRDESNNLFVVGQRGALTPGGIHQAEIFNVNGFKYNGNYSWTYYTPATMGENTVGSIATHRGVPNNFSPVWVPGSDKGSAGQLVVLHSRRDGQWGWYQFGASSLYAGWLIGAGSPGKNHFTEYTDPYVVPNSAWRSFNAAGTGLDAVVGANNQRIYYSSFTQPPTESDVERGGVGSFFVNNNHTHTKPYMYPTSYANAPHDPDAKIRQIWMGQSTTYYAWMMNGVIEIRKTSDNSLYRSIDFTTQGMIGFPSKETLQSSQGWDVIWDNNRSIFWIYYVDSSNLRNIRKFSYDHIANVLSSSSAVAGPLGASGSRIEALRLPRQKTDIRCFLIDVAMRDANLAPVSPAIVLRDISNNLAPLAPTIPTIVSFSATAAKNVDYTFNDSGDYATFHEVEIKRVSTGTVVVASGKVASGNVSGSTYRYTIAANALTNDTQYQIRIRNYDSVDAVGPWSDWKSFSTSGTGGTVTILQPASDLEPLNRSSVLVKWSYSNTTPSKVQNGYQVRVYNDATNALFSDSGIVASTATERNLTGLVSDVRYRIEVQVRDTTNALSGAGIRIVLPDYDNPSIPEIAVEPMNGYVEIRVTNPPPTGDNPVTVSNQIARKEELEADTAYKVIGTCPVNGIFKDYTVASGVEYTYKVRGSST